MRGQMYSIWISKQEFLTMVIVILISNLEFIFKFVPQFEFSLSAVGFLD